MTLAELTAHYANVRRRLWQTPPRALARPKRVAKDRPVAKLVYASPIGPKKPPGYGFARRIMVEAAAEYHVSVVDLVSERRDKRSVAARQCAMWRIKRALPWSLPRIGRAFGDRDHTTVLHAIRRHQARIDAGEAMPCPDYERGTRRKADGAN